MADDSWDIQDEMDFHPTRKPHGMKNYVLDDLTEIQQTKLNELKRDQVRSDQKYLAEHPEIRGIIIMILRILMRTRPKYDLYEAIGRYFIKPSVDLKEEIDNYVEQKTNLKSVNSCILREKISSQDEIEKDESLGSRKSGMNEMEEEKQALEGSTTESLIEDDYFEAKEICQEILDEIIQQINEDGDFSLASFGFPVDYEDHTILRSISDSILGE